MRILFLGRFQPFHNGHLEAIRKLGTMGEVVVAIGSAQYSGSFENPFTVDERERMIRAVFEAEGIEVFEICRVVDKHDGEKWIQEIRRCIPECDCAFSNKDYNRKLYQKAGLRVLDKWYFKRKDCKGLRVRELMGLGGDWRALVPEPVARIIDEIGGEERVRRYMEEYQQKDRPDPGEYDPRRGPPE
jgi:nicotinamide-nucleotide adenylyltransferase